MNKKKVLHLAERGYGGGAESVFRDTVFSLKQFDTLHSHVVACMGHDSLPFAVDLDFSLLMGRSNIIKTLSQIYSIRNYRALLAYLQKEMPDIIHIQNYGNLSPSILRAIYKYKKDNINACVLHTVHTFEYICSHHAAYDYKKKKRCIDCSGNVFKFKIFYRGCSRGGLMHSIGKGITSLIANYYISKNVIDRWITPSEFLKERMHGLRNFDSRIKAIKNPIPPIFIQDELERAERISREDVVVYFGRLSEEKNISLLIEAFALAYRMNRNIKLKIVGDGPELLRLKLLTQELGVSNAVDFIPFVNQETLKRILTKAKISVLPSKCYETASMVVLESISLGLYPIVGNYGGMKEMVNWSGIGLTFDDGDVNDLSQKIIKAVAEYHLNDDFLALAKKKISSLGLKDYADNILKEYDILFKKSNLI